MHIAGINGSLNKSWWIYRFSFPCKFFGEETRPFILQYFSLSGFTDGIPGGSFHGFFLSPVSAVNWDTEQKSWVRFGFFSWFCFDLVLPGSCPSSQEVVALAAVRVFCISVCSFGFARYCSSNSTMRLTFNHSAHVKGTFPSSTMCYPVTIVCVEKDSWLFSEEFNMMIMQM